jgi:hypothetical protein
MTAGLLERIVNRNYSLSSTKLEGVEEIRYLLVPSSCQSGQLVRLASIFSSISEPLQLLCNLSRWMLVV